MTDDSAGKTPGQAAGSLPVGLDEIIEGWLKDLADSGNALLEVGGPSRLRRVCKQWIADGGLQAGLDGLFSGCSPSDLGAAGVALQDRVQAAPTPDANGKRARRAILKLSRTLRDAARTSRTQDSPARSTALIQVLSRAAAAIQAATSSAGITRLLLDSALRLCEASSAVWWEQERPSLLSAKTCRGLRLSPRARALHLPPGFWKGASRRGQLVELSSERPEHAPLLQAVGASRGLLLRTRAGRQWTGALTIYDGDFGQERIDLLLALTHHAAAALRSLELSKESRHLTETQSRSASELCLGLASALSLDELLNVISRSGRAAAQADACLVFLADQEGPLRLRAHHGLPAHLTREQAEALTALAEETRAEPPGKPLWRTAARLRSLNHAFLQSSGYVSVLGLPLSMRGSALGCLLLFGRRPQDFTPIQRQMMVSYTAQSAVAIENLQLVEDMQRRLLEMADLTWVSTRVTATLDAEKIVATVADAASKALDVPRVALLVARSDGRYAPIPGGQLGLPEKKEDLLPDRDHLGAEAVITSAPQTVADARQEGLEDDPLVRWLGTRSLLCVPMTARHGLRGILAVGDERPRTFRAHEVALLSAYANQTALALQSALLYQDVVRHLNHLSSLFEVSQTLASSLDLSETLNRVLDSASELLGASLGSLMLIDPDTGDLVIKASRGLNTDEALYATLKPGEGLAGRAAQSATTLVSADATRDGRFKHRARARELGLRAAMAAPLIAHGRTVGVLNLYRQSSHKFTEDDKKLVMLLANSAAVAIDNARLYQEAQERGQFLAAMMGEINHRMRNTLQAVAGLLRMDVDHPGPRSTEDALRRGIARLQSVAVVHELMPAQELQFVDIKRAASRIAHLTCQTAAPDRKIQTRVSGARVMLPSQRATSVAMILSELIDNALRHGLRQRDDGLITISLAEGGGNIVIQVHDNGVGMPEDFDLETMSGLGLKVVRGLVEKELGGSLDLEMKRGLTVRARFPKHQ